MNTRHITWGEATKLFERRGVPESTWKSLYDGDYVLHYGNADVSGNFPLNRGEDHPWDEPDIGYIVDGDLTVSGSVYDIDDDAMALVVLGNLRVSGIHLTCDSKIVVTGNTTADVMFGEYTDKYLVFHGDLRTTMLALDNECAPDLVGGTLAGTMILPSYSDPTEFGATHVEDAAVPITELLVPEVLTGGRLDSHVLRERLIAGLPVLS